MKYRVRFVPDAIDDLDRLQGFLLQHADRNPVPAERAIEAIEHATALLETSPFSCRKAGANPFLRELIIPFGRSGYVALFEIVDPATVVIAAVRHQLEDDYH